MAMAIAEPKESLDASAAINSGMGQLSLADAHAYPGSFDGSTGVHHVADGYHHGEKEPRTSSDAMGNGSFSDNSDNGNMDNTSMAYGQSPMGSGQNYHYAHMVFDDASIGSMPHYSNIPVTGFGQPATGGRQQYPYNYVPMTHQHAAPHGARPGPNHVVHPHGYHPAYPVQMQYSGHHHPSMGSEYVPSYPNVLMPKSASNLSNQQFEKVNDDDKQSQREQSQYPYQTYPQQQQQTSPYPYKKYNRQMQNNFKYQRQYQHYPPQYNAYPQQQLHHMHHPQGYAVPSVVTPQGLPQIMTVETSSSEVESDTSSFTAHNAHNVHTAPFANGSSSMAINAIMTNNSNAPSGQFVMCGHPQADLKNALFFIRRSPNPTLFQVEGVFLGLACHQEGCRFVQKRIRFGSAAEQELALKVILASNASPHGSGSDVTDSSSRSSNGSNSTAKSGGKYYSRKGSRNNGVACLKSLKYPNLNALWRDEFGNFVVQAIFEHGTNDLKKELLNAIIGEEKEGSEVLGSYTGENVVALSLHLHGCRVIQKAITSLEQPEVSLLVSKFRSKVLPFIHDPNGNHVIQKSIKMLSALSKSANTPKDRQQLSDQLQFIIDDIVSNAESLSRHRYGCRVVQRAMEYCVDSQKKEVVRKVVECHGRLVDDQYGNYVVQQLLLCAEEEDLDAILKTMVEDGNFMKFSRHKYASNVVEALLRNGNDGQKDLILEELLKSSNPNENTGGWCCAIELAQDPIANYVVKSALDCARGGEKRDKLVEVLDCHRDELVKSAYARYIVAKIHGRRDSAESKGAPSLTAESNTF